MAEVPINLHFKGGAETLVGNKRESSVVLPSKKSEWLMEDLLLWIKGNMLQKQPDLFLQDDTIRPGILVMINEMDWELLDTVKYAIKPNDTILFISTLHGG